MADSILPPVLVTLLADIKQFSADMDKAMGKMGEVDATGAKLGGGISKGVSMASTAIVGLGVGVAGVGVKMAMDFQDSMTKLVTGAGESEKNIKMVGDGILAMAGKVGQTPAALASGMYLIESAGYHGAAGLKVLQASAEGAAVGGAQMSTVANALTTAMHDYNIPADKANSVTSALVQTVALGKTHLEDLAGSLGKVMPVASALGVNFQTVTGAMAEMTNSGLSARFAAMHLQTTLLALSAPSTAATKSMQEFGLNAQQIKDTLAGPNGLHDALQMIETAVGTKFPASSVQYVTALKNMLGGTVGYSTALMLSGQNAQGFAQNVEQIGQKLDGASNSVQGFNKVQQDLKFQLQQLTATGSAALIGVGQWLLPKISDVATWVSGVVDYLKTHPLISKIAEDGAIGAFALALALKLKSAVSAVFGAASDIWSGLKTILFGKTAQNAELVANTEALQANTDAMLGTGGKAGGVAGGAEGAAASGGLAGLLAKAGTSFGELGAVGAIGAAGLALGHYVLGPAISGAANAASPAQVVSPSKAPATGYAGGILGAFQHIATFFTGTKPTAPSEVHVTSLPANLGKVGIESLIKTDIGTKGVDIPKGVALTKAPQIQLGGSALSHLSTTANATSQHLPGIQGIRMATAATQANTNHLPAIEQALRNPSKVTITARFV
jgi:TP901 family phage tail tape measure protein